MDAECYNKASCGLKSRCVSVRWPKKKRRQIMHGVGIIMEIEGAHCRQSRALLLSIRQGALWKHIHTPRNGPQRKTEQRSNTEPAGLKMEWDVCFAHRLFCISLSSKATMSNQLHTPGKTENQHCFMNKSFFSTSCLFLVMNWHRPPSFFASPWE